MCIRDSFYSLFRGNPLFKGSFLQSPEISCPFIMDSTRTSFDPTLETLQLLQSTVSSFQYVVKMKENTLTDNFYSLIRKRYSSVKKETISSINKMNQFCLLYTSPS